MPHALSNHWPEYMIEAAGLCFFMISACAFATLLFHPISPVPAIITNPMPRRFLMGIAMGLTAVAIVYSPWGKRSGAHINPSVTLTFFRLGKVEPWDALFYILAQFAGGITGVLVASVILGQLLADPNVNYVTTMPGPDGQAVAFIAEVLISFLLMTMVLNVSNNGRLARRTGLFAGTLVALYISFESPLSGMSMNPARTFGSALRAGAWTSLWIYFTAPPLGMFLAAHVYTSIKGKHSVACAKLHHRNNKRCIFRCGYEEQVTGKGSYLIPDTRHLTPILKGDSFMSQRKLTIVIIALVVAVAGWYAFRPERLFVNQKVNEQFPTASAQTLTLATGRFHSVAHETKGTATVYQMPDGKKTLRLTDFQTSNGPDVVVYLVAAFDANDAETVKNASPVLLGSLKGNIGDQNYDVPADVDLTKYRAVTVWCRRFGVNFATAPLSQGQATASVRPQRLAS